MKSTRYYCQVFMKIYFFFDRFLTNTQISNSMKIRPVGFGLSHAMDRPTDVTKALVPFRSFAKASENSCVKAVSLYVIYSSIREKVSRLHIVIEKKRMEVMTNNFYFST